MAKKVAYRRVPVSLPVIECLNPKCKHRWIPRIGEPQQCPVCKGRRWHRIGMTR